MFSFALQTENVLFTLIFFMRNLLVNGLLGLLAFLFGVVVDWIEAVGVESTCGAFGVACGADVAAVEDEPVVGCGDFVLWDVFDEGEFGFEG